MNDLVDVAFSLRRFRACIVMNLLTKARLAELLSAPSRGPNTSHCFALDLPVYGALCVTCSNAGNAASFDGFDGACGLLFNIFSAVVDQVKKIDSARLIGNRVLQGGRQKLNFDSCILRAPLLCAY